MACSWHQRLSGRRWRSGITCVVVAAIPLAWSALAPSPAAPQPNPETDEEASPYLPGLIVEVRRGQQVAYQRVVPQVAWHHPDALPDGLRLRWRGALMSETDGPYYLHVYTDLPVRLTLNGTAVLQTRSGHLAWHSSTPIPLSFGWHPLELEILSSPGGRVSLYWTGPQFVLEPLTERHLMHDRREVKAQQYERGRLLARALSCDACHGGKPDELMAAPSLRKLAGNIYPEWVADWLGAQPTVASGDRRETGHRGAATDSTDVTSESVETFHGRRMPFFRIEQDVAYALAAYLTGGAKSRPSSDRSANDEKDRQEGRRLFLTVGCLACHGMESFGDSGFFGGSNLSQIASKRPPTFFEAWLESPHELNPRHRMPVFPLSSQERRLLSRFLAAQGSPPAARPDRFADAAPADSGREHFRKLRCGACHDGPDDGQPPPALSALDVKSRWHLSCAGLPPSTSQPAYGLSVEDQDALALYYGADETIRKLLAEAAELPDLLLKNNCIQCHARGSHPGLAGRAAAVWEAFPELAPQAAAMTPPSLNSTGDKLHDSALRQAVTVQGPPRRDWLLVRMPKYQLPPQELDHLLEQLVRVDRIPPDAPQSAPVASGDFPEAVAARLVTPDGFGCTSCHSVGKVRAPNAPLNTLGPNLAMLGERIRRPWYERWVRNPSRIVPRMEMPSIQAPVPGVLDENLSLQLAAVWEILNRPTFRPPEPNPVRTVRRANIPALNERAVVLTDILHTPQAKYVQPLLLALPNRHNVLFDLAEARLAQWWIGDTARQRTVGKTWFWESGAPPLAVAQTFDPEIALRFDSQLVTAARRGQFTTYFDWVQHRQGGIEFAYRLLFPVHDQAQTVQVRQTFLPIWGNASGFARHVTIENVPPNAMVLLRLWSQSPMSAGGADGTLRFMLDENHSIWMEVESSDQPVAPDNPLFELRPQDGRVQLACRYMTSLPVDQFPPGEKVERGRSPVTLPVVPGFRAVRLPFTDEIMPTGLAFDRRGRLLITSLKGRVWRAEDVDGDDWEDRVVPISDELAAPYGIAVRGDAIDVINKYALLRLKDVDSDGVMDRMETLAAGWGHTDDYHDWAVGLPDDGQDGYFIALPCQQDERPREATRFRGMVLQVTPATQGMAAEWPMVLQPLTGGHRFPMGLARNRLGWLFATDNQGNYNPFNELNFIRPGSHFGFINAWEQRAAITPATHTPPAINIPHPWTRSVNGICFLETPQTQEGMAPVFGPFEGHLLGCEYDTRRLIRMTVEKIAEVVQGAAYPLSLDPPPQGPTFLGPLVCAVSPKGHVYVGSIRDSGWGGANNIGEVIRMVPTWDELPVGIRQVRAARDGFILEFTRPVHRQKASDPSSYVVHSYRRIATPAYGGPDVDRRTDRITAVHLSDDAQQVYLKLSQLREGFVYEFHLKNLSPVAGAPFFPQEAYYTLHVKGNGSP